MKASDSVLIVVDVQNGFVSSRSAHIVPAVADLVERWSGQGLPYVMSRFHNSTGSPFETLIQWTRMQEAPETDIVDELAAAVPGALAVIDKSHYSSFTDELVQLQREHGWTNIVVAGIATESCVLKTAVDAFEANLTPWIVTDASYSHAGEEAHEAGLLVARRFIGRGQLITSSQLMEMTRGQQLSA
ncbi:MAG: cysteine hydrolase family protein [Pseudonocardiaceae bacterium]